VIHHTRVGSPFWEAKVPRLLEPSGIPLPRRAHLINHIGSPTPKGNNMERPNQRQATVIQRWGNDRVDSHWLKPCVTKIILLHTHTQRRTLGRVGLVLAMLVWSESLASSSRWQDAAPCGWGQGSPVTTGWFIILQISKLKGEEIKQLLQDFSW
jgi:hypothetical protein